MYGGVWHAMPLREKVYNRVPYIFWQRLFTQPIRGTLQWSALSHNNLAQI